MVSVDKMEFITERYKKKAERLWSVFKSEKRENTHEDSEIRKNLLEREAVILGFKYRPRSETFSDFIDNSHFADVVNNMISKLKIYTQARRLNYSQRIENYLETLSLLKIYLKILDASQKIRDAEMGTKEGYLLELGIKSDLPPSQYISKLKERLAGGWF